MNKVIGCLMIALVTFTSCGEDKVLLPKQRMYPQINFPQRKIIQLDTNFCDFTFPYPDYFTFLQDSFYFDGKPKDECWFNLNNVALNSTLHCSYYPIRSRKEFDELIADAFTITDKHNIKANARRENLISNENGVSGILFEVDGPVASPVQFFLTDSTKHFFRASLYFNAKVNPDSTAPVYKFINEDLLKMIEGFKWKQ